MKSSVVQSEVYWELNGDPLINVLSFGWTEDGRCGYEDNKNHMQLCPRPVSGFMREEDDTGKLFVCKKASAGNRHTAFLLINCTKEVSAKDYEEKSRKIAIVGLNQHGLCEERGTTELTDLVWDMEEIPNDIVAGNGVTFIITHYGNIYSCGNGSFGVLGHNDFISQRIPKQIKGLIKQRIASVSAGHSHVTALSDQGKLYSWGRNQHGQLGIGANVDIVSTTSPSKPGKLSVKTAPEVSIYDRVYSTPQAITYFGKNEVVLAVSCGQFHTLALVEVTNTILEQKKQIIYVWGDGSRGQLGSANIEHRHRPQENRWVTQLMNKLQISGFSSISAGGFHNLILTLNAGQIISWGGGDYGQLGTGFAWDDAKPRLISTIKDIIGISAGLRHSMAIKMGNPNEVFCWGYNGYGECGLGDADIRLQPTMITGFSRVRPMDISAGWRHSVIISSHKPMIAKEEPSLRPYFNVLKEGNISQAIKRQLKADMRLKGIDSDLLDDENAIVVGQPGSTLDEVKNERFERGLRYCLDTRWDPGDWRRKTYETCYMCPSLKLRSVCLSCARHCLYDLKLVPYIRLRGRVGKIEKPPESPVLGNQTLQKLSRLRSSPIKSGRSSPVKKVPGQTNTPKELVRDDNKHCDCIKSGRCQCSWSPLRNEFDKIASITDQKIGPNQVRALLQILRAPAPVDSADVEECLLALAEGEEHVNEPRIGPVDFEVWYRVFYQDNSDDRLLVHYKPRGKKNKKR